jgi:hypothetical protein
MDQRDWHTLAACLHPQVTLCGPLSTLEGKEAVIEAAKKFALFFRHLHVREAFASAHKAMLALEFECPPPPQGPGLFPGASLLAFEDGLIRRIDLFYDGRPFAAHSGSIFRS